MIDFACKHFNLKDIIKCGLGLTRTEFIIFEYFLDHAKEDLTTQTLADALHLNVTTVQKAVKKLNEKEVITRFQENLEKGGYVFTYRCTSKTHIRTVLKGIIKNWSNKVEKKIDSW